MLNNKIFDAILQFMEEKNNLGKKKNDCPNCDNCYTYNRAYINQDGDYVFSKDTLTELLDVYKYSKKFEPRTSGLGDSYYEKYLDSLDADGNKDGFILPEDLVRTILVKKEYANKLIAFKPKS